MKKILKRSGYKKIVAVMIALLLMLGDMSSIAHAAEIEESNIQLDDISGMENTTELNKMLAERGRALRKRRLDDRGFMLNNIGRLLQNDSRWRNVIIGTKKVNDTVVNVKMGDEGCAITSFAIVSNWLSNTSITPEDVKNRMENSAYPFSWVRAETLYGYDLAICEMVDSGIANGEDIILGAIDMFETPVIVGMQGPDTTHFVVAYGYDSNYNIIISDPSGRNYTLLSQYFNKGYYIHRIYMYLK